MALEAPLPTQCAISDEKLGQLEDDPRKLKQFRLKGLVAKGGGTNTESFDPNTTLQRPELRIKIGSNKKNRFGKSIKHDDIIMVPEFFCEEEDLSLYYEIIAEFREMQEKKESSSWEPWHEGCHLVCKKPEKSAKFNELIEKASTYFDLREGKRGVRFNWYKDSSDWKPFHHDSAAFNKERSKLQNFTIGISLGRERELAFLHAKNGSRVYFPQSNGMMFAFGRDVNIKWKHAINALPLEEQNGLGRVSVIVWGYCESAVEEPNSPPMISNTRNKGRKHRKKNQGRKKKVTENSSASLRKTKSEKLGAGIA